jgi:hypothetical protein
VCSSDLESVTSTIQVQRVAARPPSCVVIILNGTAKD